MSRKLLYSLISMVIAFVLLVTASLAWFTVSTNPEITGIQVSVTLNEAILVSKTEDGEFTRSIDLTEEFAYYAPLTPCSTVDGVNWYIPAYDLATGELLEISEFELDDDLTYANSFIYEEVDDVYVLKEDNEYYAALQQGYYVYTDIYLTTQEDYCTVSLSVPAGTMEDWEAELGTYGTYTLPGFQYGASYVDGIETTDTVMIDGEAQTSLRAGFLIEEEEDDETTSEFYIYEPNAFDRTTGKGELDNEDDYIQYVKEYDYSAENYLDNTYYPTYAIANIDGVATLQTILDQYLMVQDYSAWDTEELETAIENDSIDSNTVETMGQFIVDNSVLYQYDENDEVINPYTVAVEEGETVDTDALYVGLDDLITTENFGAASSTIITSLEKDEVQRVRLFIWIEGQDVDCWNDISGANLYMNLELAGTITTNPNTSSTNTTSEEES